MAKSKTRNERRLKISENQRKIMAWHRRKGKWRKKIGSENDIGESESNGERKCAKSKASSGSEIAKISKSRKSIGNQWHQHKSMA
jgi:hypothetical protein